jgi:hypothetical protein
MIAKVNTNDLGLSRCILMYMNGTHQDTIRIHAGYITIHQDTCTYPIGPPPQNDRKPHVTRRTSESVRYLIKYRTVQLGQVPVCPPVFLNRGTGRTHSQVGFAAAVAHARLRLSRLELIGGSGRTAGRYTRLLRAPSFHISPIAFRRPPIAFRRPPSSRRGEALWERVAAGSGSLWAASSVTL